MSSSIEDSAANRLHSTIITALQQSNDVVNQLRDQQRTIERLRKENESLKQELEQAHSSRPAGQHGAGPPPYDLEQLFRQGAEKQAEVDRLRKELRNVQAKERKWRKQSHGIASPMVTSDEPECSPQTIPSTAAPAPARIPPTPSSPEEPQRDKTASSPPRKKLRKSVDGNDSSRPLVELNTNQAATDIRHRDRPKDRLARGAEAIPVVTEDGEDHNRVENVLFREHKRFEKRDDSAFHRLGGLLSTPTVGNHALTRPQHRISKSSSPASRDSNMPMLRPISSDLAKEAMKPMDRTKKRFLPPKSKPAPGAEDEDPLRARPVMQLNLSHFRLNPAVNEGYDFAFSETVRDREKRKCLPGCTQPCCAGTIKFIMDTLGSDLNISDDDLLLEYLGPGSEQKIRSMTKLARDNLVHDAKSKKVADKYGKMHRNQHERAQSPVGFWDTDMPSTQEELKNREEARRREREEVQKRYMEAGREGGKWVFADE